jgi:cob(I)alamin adenosyltransferase
MVKEAEESQEKKDSKDSIGLIHVYVGEGQGKTSAAVGLAVRARGAGLSVLLAQLFKHEPSELKSLKKLGVDCLQYSLVHPYFKKYSSRALDEQAKGCKDFVEKAFRLAKKDKYDVLILDEIGPAVSYALLSEDELAKMVKAKPKRTELVMTGRGIPESIISLADYVTELTLKKHPYNKGILARKGIDF